MRSKTRKYLKIYRLRPGDFTNYERSYKELGLGVPHCVASVNLDVECGFQFVEGDGVVAKNAKSVWGSSSDPLCLLERKKILYDPYCALEKRIVTSWSEMEAKLGKDPYGWVIDARKRIPNLDQRIEMLKAELR